jgi:zinc protease
MKIQTVTSPSGVEAWLVEDHTVPLLALRFAFEGGSAQDPVGKEGVANFVTQLLDQGAGDLTALAFQERVKDLALHIGFKVGKDTLSGSLKVLTESRDEAAHLLKLAITRPRFDTDAVERVRQRIAISITRAVREPDHVASTQWDAVAFAEHEYARPVSGTEETVSEIAVADLVGYRKRVFARDTLKVVAVGDITPEELGKLLDDVFGDLLARANLTPVRQADPIAGGRQAVVDMDVPQSTVVFGLEAIPRHDPDYLAASVLNHIFGGGGFTSRLMEEVRVKRGLVYSISSSLALSRHASILRGGFATRNDRVGVALDVIRAELRKLVDGEIDQRELDTAKSYLIGSYALDFDANSKIASQLLGLRLGDYPPQYVDNRNALVAAVTLEDVKRVAKRLLDPDNLVVTVVGKPVLRSETEATKTPATSAA